MSATLVTSENNPSATSPSNIAIRTTSTAASAAATATIIFLSPVTGEYNREIPSTTTPTTMLVVWTRSPPVLTFSSRMELVGHLSSHHTVTGDPVPGAPNHSKDRRLHSPHCPREFTHRIGSYAHS
ncbi:unnamed protein product [Schistocephalus solidus]|uniref:Uncharacterized protein n=1 Tax=Schistocephalus solidus TaxID=70667 RepID=A0A183TH33_SCHSO|nr:unnamed protein product [Schistocephalus solidus]